MRAGDALADAVSGGAAVGESVEFVERELVGFADLNVVVRAERELERELVAERHLFEQPDSESDRECERVLV